MKRPIPSSGGEAVAPLERLEPRPETLRFPLAPGVNRCEVRPVVRAGESVRLGDALARGEALVLHASASGLVERADAEAMVLRCADAEAPAFDPTPPSGPAWETARDMGWVGMGGSMFPASLKLKAAAGVHTLVVNAVECEPGVQIDEALLLHEPDPVRAGVAWLVGALGLSRTVLAVKRPAARRLRAFADSCRARVLVMPNRYPGGAEKLLVGRLARRPLPAGVLPMRRGFLVFSVASLWALGRRLRLGEPSVLRPLSVVAPPAPTRNLVAPVGTSVRHILESCAVPYDPAAHVLVAGGLMMGRAADPDDPVLKGTTAILVAPRDPRLTRPEAPCILCGSCFDACPLNLHPSGMADRLREKRLSRALAAQLDECFLCGACSAVCPADIPLAQIFREGKAWLRNPV